MKVIVDKAQSGSDVVVKVIDNNDIIVTNVVVDHLPEKDGIVIYKEPYSENPASDFAHNITMGD